MRSTNSLIFAGGGVVHCETVSATVRFKNMPTFHQGGTKNAQYILRDYVR